MPDRWQWFNFYGGSVPRETLVQKLCRERPDCALCKKPVSRVLLSQKGGDLLVTAYCHGDFEEQLISRRLALEGLERDGTVGYGTAFAGSVPPKRIEAPR